MLAVGMVSAAWSLSAAVTIDPGKAEIISSGGATKLAADELQLHLEKITGVKVPIRGAATPGAYAFRLEKTVLGPNVEPGRMKIVSPGADTKPAAEALQAALGKITGFCPEIVTSPIPGSHNFTFKPMPEGSADDFAWQITGEVVRSCRSSTWDSLAIPLLSPVFSTCWICCLELFH